MEFISTEKLKIAKNDYPEDYYSIKIRVTDAIKDATDNISALKSSTTELKKSMEALDSYDSDSDFNDIIRMAEEKIHEFEKRLIDLKKQLDEFIKVEKE